MIRVTWPNSIRCLLISLFTTLNGFAVAQDARLKTIIDDYVNAYVRTGNFSGSILVAKNGQMVYENSFGLADADFQIANQPSTRYHISSVSKNFTAAGILLLEERGKLNLTDAISKYIPDYPGGSEITIHYLLTHTSGITNVNDLPEYNVASRSHQTPESLILLFKNKPLEFDPGSRFQYSNSNYNVLAFIIESVSKLSYGEFLRKEIFTPSGMMHTLHHGDAHMVVPNLAVGYQGDGNFGIEKSDYLDWSSKTGNGSLVTAASDLLLWDRALTSNTILSKASVDKMYTNHGSNSGYGCYVRDHFGRKRVYMNGRSPGFTSYFARYPSEGVCIIVLANNYIPVATTIGLDIAAILFNEKYEKPVLLDEPIKPGIAKRLLGRYKFGPDFYRPNYEMNVKESGHRLTSDWGEMIPQGDYKYIIRNYWSSVVFEADKQGDIKKMIIDGFPGVRMD